MVGEPKREGLMGLMAGPGLGVGSFGKPDSVGVDRRQLEEVLSLIEKASASMPSDQRRAFLRVMTGRMLSALNATVSSDATWEKANASASLTELSGQILTWLEKKAIGGTNAGNLVEIAGEAAPVETASTQRTVPIDSAIRGGSYFTASISIMSLVATAMSNVIIIQPFIALLFLIASVGFFCMTLVPHDRAQRDS